MGVYAKKEQEFVKADQRFRVWKPLSAYPAEKILDESSFARPEATLLLLEPGEEPFD